MFSLLTSVYEYLSHHLNTYLEVKEINTPPDNDINNS